MTEEEVKRWQAVIDAINADRTDYLMKESMTTNIIDAEAYSKAANALEVTLQHIATALHEVINDEYQKAMEEDIARMEHEDQMELLSYLNDDVVDTEHGI